MARERVTAILWPDVAEKRAKGRLRTALWRLGSAREEFIQCDGDHVELAATCGVDLHDAQAIARELLTGAVPPLDGDTLIDLFSRDLLPHWDEAWVDSERECYRETRVHVLETLAARFLESDDYFLAIKASLSAIRCSPFRDTSHRLLVHSYRAEGNWVAALRHLLRYRDEVRSELGLPPSRVLPDLYQELANWSEPAFP